MNLESVWNHENTPSQAPAWEGFYPLVHRMSPNKYLNQNIFILNKICVNLHTCLPRRNLRHLYVNFVILALSIQKSPETSTISGFTSMTKFYD